MEWLRTSAKLRSKLTRWSMVLSEYEFDIVRRPGANNVVSDYMSRHPVETDPATYICNYMAQYPTIVSEATVTARTCIIVAFAQGAVHASIDATEAHSRDIWPSHDGMQYVRGELTERDVTPEQRASLKSRWRHFTFINGRIRKTVSAKGGIMVEVPPPSERVSIIQRIHNKIGHLGRDRTYMLVKHCAWPRMHEQTAEVVRGCVQCDRVRATFSTKHDRLKPMPINGMFYRFSIDYAGPFTTISGEKEYVIVIVEHFSKWIDPVHVRGEGPEGSLTATTTSRAFQERVLARYGAPVEVVSDNGSEYRGEFLALLRQHGIEHVEIPAGHPSTNGMAERIVRVMKESLRKYVHAHGMVN